MVTASHNKFWEVTEHDAPNIGLTVHWGRIGTAGSTVTHTFHSLYERNKKKQKLISEKLAKGYREIVLIDLAAMEQKALAEKMVVCELD